MVIAGMKLTTWFSALSMLVLTSAVNCAEDDDGGLSRKIFVQPDTPDTLDLVQRIREKIIATSTVTTEVEMKPYTMGDAKPVARYSMVKIPGGTFLMGSPEQEANRKPDEGPQVSVRISPFWMGSHEVTWNQYMPFLEAFIPRHRDGSPKSKDLPKALVDAVSRPTVPYVDVTWGMGDGDHPAICMTEHAANKYCEWLSALTGNFYRLPTEAEWEYAARAGTTTAYFFGNDPAELGKYAWHLNNSDYGESRQAESQLVGQKLPNPWGLYDIYGNVSEWVMDQYAADYYSALGTKLVTDPCNIPKTLYPRVVRGGSYRGIEDTCRSAKRRASKPSWKMQDPELPKSAWYHTDATFVGFRIVRPLAIPSAEVMYRIWNQGLPE